MSVFSPVDSSGTVFKTVGNTFKRRIVLTFDPKSFAELPVPALTVTAAALEDSTGNFAQPTLTVSGAPAGVAATPTVTIPAPATSPVILELQASLEHMDDYQGFLRVQFAGGQIQVKPLKITRTEAEMPYRVDSYSSEGTQDVTFTLEKTTRGPVDAVQVGLAWLAPLVNGTPPIGTADTVAALKKGTSACDATFTPPGGTANGVLPSTPAGAPAPLGPFDVKMAVKCLTDPGLYSGELTFTSDTYKRTTQPFTLAVHRSGWLVLLVAMGGAAIAAVLQYLTADQRPRLVVRQYVAQLLWQCEALRKQFAFDATELSVMQAIQDQITAVRDDAQSSGTPAATWLAASQATLKTESDKLTQFTTWVTARRQYATAQGLDPVGQTAIQKTLADVQQGLQSNDALGGPIRASLSGLSASIDDAQALAFASSLTDLKTQITTELAKADPNSAAFQKFTTAQQTSQQADAALRLNHFADFTQAFDTAGLQFSQAQALALRGNLLEASLTSAPGTWAPVLEALMRVSSASTAAQAQAAYQVAYVAYTKVQTALAIADVEAIRKVASTVGSPVDSDLEAAKDALGTVTVAGSASPQGITGLSAALGFIKRAKATVNNAGGNPSVTAATVLPGNANAPLLLQSLPALHLPSPMSSTPDSWQELKARSLTNYLVTAGVALVISGVVAWSLLWLPNPTWGQASDIIAALLWGLGVHSLSTTTVSSIMTQFAGQ